MYVDVSCRGKVYGSICFDNFQDLMQRLNSSFPYLVCYQTYDDSLHVDESILLDVLFGNF